MLGMLGMLGSFDRCNLMLRMNIWGMLMFEVNVGMLGVDVKNEYGLMHNHGLL